MRSRAACSSEQDSRYCFSRWSYSSCRGHNDVTAGCDDITPGQAHLDTLPAAQQLLHAGQAAVAAQAALHQLRHQLLVLLRHGRQLVAVVVVSASAGQQAGVKGQAVVPQCCTVTTRLWCRGDAQLCCSGHKNAAMA